MDNIDSMIKRYVHVVNKLGLHARACSKLIEVTNRFESKILIGHESNMVDGKNIISLLMLGAGKGRQLALHVEGDDANEAVEAIAAIFAARFGESE